jgi:TonB-dependent SusC/RagA subfamily outer membrane receptor
MESFLIYIGKAAIGAGAFYLVFRALFQNQKHFGFNRIYLPVSMLLSFVIPLITFTSVKYVEPGGSDTNSFAYLAGTTAPTHENNLVFEWYHYLFGLYVAGSLIFLFHLLLGHLKAIQIIRKSWIQQLFGNRVNVTKKEVHPFSFFQKIVLSEKTLNSEDLQMIVFHENIHVKEKHTLDILFAEILFLFQWFNPFAWLLKDAVKNNLEYKTDHQIAQRFNPQKYQLAMVALADKKGVAPFLTALNGSQLKNRIIMMKKKTENRYTFVKQLVVLPLLAILVMGLSSREVKTEIVYPQNENSSLLNEIQKTITISGKITNEKGEPVEKVAVLIKGKPVGTITDTNGNYKITLENETETLIFTLDGFEKQEIAIAGKQEINVQLKKDDSGKSSEVRVVGYGNQDLSGEKVQLRLGNDKNQPLYIVDGKEMETIEFLSPEAIKSISVLKDQSATELYGEKGKNGVIFIETKTAKPFDSDGKTVIVDGKEYAGDINDIPIDEISSISVLKGETASPKVYGENAKNGVLIVNTKTKYNSGLAQKDAPYILIDGKEYTRPVSDIDPETIEKIDVLKGESAKKLYGEKAKDGAILITTKTGSKITTPLELRKFIARHMKYPVKAQEKGAQGTVYFHIELDKTVKVVSIHEYQQEDIINLDEVVVVAYALENTPAVDSENVSSALIEEARRVIQMLPEVDIPEYKNKAIGIAVKFMLQ